MADDSWWGEIWSDSIRRSIHAPPVRGLKEHLAPDLVDVRAGQ
jgi:hypothetical protein